MRYIPHILYIIFANILTLIIYSNLQLVMLDRIMSHLGAIAIVLVITTRPMCWLDIKD